MNSEQKIKVLFRNHPKHQWVSFGIFPSDTAGRVVSALEHSNTDRGVWVEVTTQEFVEGVTTQEEVKPRRKNAKQDRQDKDSRSVSKKK